MSIEGEDLSAENGHVSADVPAVGKVASDATRSEEIAALRIQVLAMQARIDELEGLVAGASAAAGRRVPGWEDPGHRHTEEEFT